MGWARPIGIALRNRALGGEKASHRAALYACCGLCSVTTAAYMFRKIGDAVMQATNNLQEPFVYGRLPGDPIYLVAPQ